MKSRLLPVARLASRSPRLPRRMARRPSWLRLLDAVQPRLVVGANTPESQPLQSRWRAVSPSKTQGSVRASPRLSAREAATMRPAVVEAAGPGRQQHQLKRAGLQARVV